MTSSSRARTYYAHHKSLVCFRKILKRCKETGAVPHARTVRTHAVPFTALLVAFGEWAGHTRDLKRIHRQQLKLANLRAALHVTAPSPRELYTSVVKREVDEGARGVVGAKPERVVLL